MLEIINKLKQKLTVQYDKFLRTNVYLAEKHRNHLGEWVLTFHNIRGGKVRKVWSVVGRRVQWRWLDTGVRCPGELEYFLFQVWAKEDLGRETKSSKVINLNKWKKEHGE